MYVGILILPLCSIMVKWQVNFFQVYELLWIMILIIIILKWKKKWRQKIKRENWERIKDVYDRRVDIIEGD